MNSKLSAADRIRQVLAEQLGQPLEAVTPEATLVGDLSADSLDLVEVVMALEEDFELEIPDEEPERWKTVGDVVSYIERRAGVVDCGAEVPRG